MTEEKRKVGRPKSVEPVAEAPLEGIELQIEGFMFNILTKMEQKLTEAITNFQPPAPTPLVAQGVVPRQVTSEEQVRLNEVAEINAERLGQFKKDKQDMIDKAVAEALERKGL